MMRPSSEKPDVNWNNHGHVSEDVGERVFDDELIDDPESDARPGSSAKKMSPLVWGAAAFAGVVTLGLVLRSRRKPRWPALLNVTIAAPPAPARRAMLSTIGGAVARFAFQRLMAAQREALASIAPEADASKWKAASGTAARSSATPENGHGS